MSAGRSWIKELYVGFLLLALTFLYLSHLNTEFRSSDLEQIDREPAELTSDSEMIVPAAKWCAEEFVTT